MGGAKIFSERHLRGTYFLAAEDKRMRSLTDYEPKVHDVTRITNAKF